MLKDGSHGASYTVGVFLHKKDAIISAKENDKYVYNKMSDTYDNKEDEIYYRYIERVPLLNEPKPVDDINMM